MKKSFLLSNVKQELRKELEGICSAFIEEVNENFPNATAEIDLSGLSNKIDKHIDKLWSSLNSALDKDIHIEMFNKVQLDFESEFPDRNFNAIVEKFDKGVEDSDTDEFKKWVSEWAIKNSRVRSCGFLFNDILFKETADLRAKLKEVEEGLQNAGFEVFVDLNNLTKSGKLYSYEEAKKLVETSAKAEIARMNSKGYSPHWEIYYTNCKGEFLLAINDLSVGKMEHLEVDNGSEYVFAEPEM